MPLARNAVTLSFCQVARSPRTTTASFVSNRMGRVSPAWLERSCAFDPPAGGDSRIGGMSEFISPVPVPAVDAQAPEPYEGIYGMPMFLTVPTSDLTASREFWLRGLGFIDLFSIPGRLTHLRRWAFQDVLLVPGDSGPSALSVSFACVLGQLDEVAGRC